jgi:lipoate-protein ligase B
MLLRSCFSEVKTVQAFKHSIEQPWTYSQLDDYQREIYQRLLTSESEEGVLLISEVAPVITLGRRSRKWSDLALGLHYERKKYEDLGIAILETDRGGLATYHGEGQWVIFWVERSSVISPQDPSVRGVVCVLLKKISTFLTLKKISHTLGSGAEQGIWTPKGKIASIGIRVQNGVVLHGVCLNLYPTELSFFGMSPCGLASSVDYLSNY